MTGQTGRASYLGMPGERPPRLGFFTDTSICIGCVAAQLLQTPVGPLDELRERSRPPES